MFADLLGANPVLHAFWNGPVSLIDAILADELEAWPVTADTINAP